MKNFTHIKQTIIALFLFITINTAANASCNASFQYSINGYNVQFYDSSSGTGITTYQWSFGDGTSSPLMNPAHFYTTVGYNAPV